MNRLNTEKQTYILEKMHDEIKTLWIDYLDKSISTCIQKVHASNPHWDHNKRDWLHVQQFSNALVRVFVWLTDGTVMLFLHTLLQLPIIANFYTPELDMCKLNLFTKPK